MHGLETDGYLVRVVCKSLRSLGAPWPFVVRPLISVLLSSLFASPRDHVCVLLLCYENGIEVGVRTSLSRWRASLFSDRTRRGAQDLPRSVNKSKEGPGEVEVARVVSADSQGVPSSVLSCHTLSNNISILYAFCLLLRRASLSSRTRGSHVPCILSSLFFIPNCVVLDCTYRWTTRLALAFRCAPVLVSIAVLCTRPHTLVDPLPSLHFSGKAEGRRTRQKTSSFSQGGQFTLDSLFAIMRVRLMKERTCYRRPDELLLYPLCTCTWGGLLLCVSTSHVIGG